MRHSVLLVSSVLSLSAAGCAKAPPRTSPTGGIDYRFSATAERVWSALRLAYTDLEIPITTMDKAGWSVRTQSWILSWWQARDWTNCNANEGVTLNITTLLLPRGDSTVMRLNVEATHWVRPNTRVGEQPPSNCNLIPSGGYPGEGVFEQQIFEAVRQHLY